MKKVLKKDREAFVKAKLATNPNWAKQALLRIFSLQTDEEQNYGETIEHNNIGFTGCDAEILTSFAKQYEKNKRLSDKQMSILMRKMKKYWKQVIMCSNTEKLDNLIINQKN